MNVFKVLVRLLICPLIIPFIITWITWQFFVFVYRFILYGGEFLVYNENETKTISDIYHKLKTYERNNRKSGEVGVY